MTSSELIARGRVEVKKVYVEKFGRVKWFLMSPDEKDNYAVAWALGYATANEESKTAQK